MHTAVFVYCYSRSRGRGGRAEAGEAVGLRGRWEAEVDERKVVDDRRKIKRKKLISARSIVDGGGREREK